MDVYLTFSLIVWPIAALTIMLMNHWDYDDFAELFAASGVGLLCAAVWPLSIPFGLVVMFIRFVAKRVHNAKQLS